MPYEIETDIEHGIVRLCMFGETDLKQHEIARQEVGLECLSTKCWKLLVDLHRVITEGFFSFSDALRFAEHFDSNYPDFRHSLSIAVILPISDDSIHLIEVAAGALRCKGMNLQTFDDEKGAIHWLTNQCWKI